MWPRCHLYYFFHLCSPPAKFGSGPLTACLPILCCPMGQGSYGYRISLSPAFVHVVPLTFLVWKLFSLPLVVLQEELLYV